MYFSKHVALFTLSNKSWEPICDGQWIIAKIWTESGILRIAVSNSEFFDEKKIILQSKIRKSSQWILVSEDFAEFEDKYGTRYGMYFESDSDAINFTANISAGLIEIESPPQGLTQPPPLPHLYPSIHRLNSVPESASADEKENDVTSPYSNGTLNSRGQIDSVRIMSMGSANSNHTRRKSLALFKEIDDAMGEAFSHANQSPTGSMEANFTGAVNAQIVAMAGRDRTLPSEVSPQETNTTPTTTTQPRRASQVVGTASCLPSRKAEPAVPAADPVISAPNSFKHAVKVVFNEELSRFEGLPPEWNFQNQQYGVPLEQLQKRIVPGYSHGIPTLLVMLKKHLFENNGHLEVGIFRLAPDKDACLEIKNQINTGRYEGTNDVNILANLIKVFFRELPVNIFNTLSDDVIHRIARLSVAETIPAMETILEGKSGALIYWLLDLMAEVVVYEDTNKMSARNMAIVLSPNLYAVSSDNAMVALTMAQKVAEFTTNLLSARLKSKYHYEPRTS